MSSEIKFRGWLKGTDKPFPKINAEDYTYVFNVSPNGQVNAGSWDEDGFWRVKQVEVDQFIGLQDKKGKDIYEGDIVKFTEEDTASFVGPVDYMADDDYPAFDIPDKYIPTGWGFETNVISDGVARGIIEVIGNVRENPDLLEADE